METLILIMSICSFILGSFGAFLKTEGFYFIVLFYKIISLFAMITPIIYWLKILNII